MSTAPEHLPAPTDTEPAVDLLLTSGLVVIERAKLALSARFGVTPDEAFELLSGLAHSQRRELHEFAAEVLRNRGRLDGDIVGDSGRLS